MAAIVSRTTQVKGLLQISVGDLRDPRGLKEPHVYFIFESKEAARKADRGVIADVQATDALAEEFRDQYMSVEKMKKCPVLQIFGLKPAHAADHIRAYVARKIQLVSQPIQTNEELTEKIETAMRKTALADAPYQVRLTQGDPTVFDFRNPAHFQGKLPPVVEEWLQASGR